MWLLLNPKLWIAAAVLAALTFTHFTAYRSGKAAVTSLWNAEKLEYTAKALKTEQEARAKEQKLLAQRQQVEKKYVDEKQKAAAAAIASKSALDSLRYELTKAPASCPTAADPTAASRAAGGARLERDLLGACAAALTDLATEADRLEAIIVGLQQYVKNVCLAKN